MQYYKIPSGSNAGRFFLCNDTLAYSKLEVAAEARCGLNPNSSLVQLHNFFTMRKANTCALIFRSCMQPLKNQKYLFIIFFVNPNTIVFKNKMPVTSYFFHQNIYLWGNSLFFKFKRIGDQVLKQLLHFSGIAIDNRQPAKSNVGFCFADSCTNICKYSS